MSLDTTIPLLLVDDNLQIRSAIRSDVHAAASAEEARTRLVLPMPAADA